MTLGILNQCAPGVGASHLDPRAGTARLGLDSIEFSIARRQLRCHSLNVYSIFQTDPSGLYSTRIGSIPLFFTFLPKGYWTVSVTCSTSSNKTFDHGAGFTARADGGSASPAPQDFCKACLWQVIDASIDLRDPNPN